MCQDKLHEFLVALPKVEQHMHLEGSLEPPLLFKLAEKNKITLPEDDEAFSSVESLLSRYRRFTSLDDFLHYYFIGMKTLIHSSDFEDLAYTYFTKAHSQNVQHAEVFFDPQAHTTRGVALQTLLTGFKRAQERALSDFGLTSELIVCLLRDYTPAECHESYLTFLPDLKSGAIRGLGLSSTEKGRPPSLFKSTFADAVSHDLNLTAHAGEEADVTYMAGAVQELNCKRIDHGIKLSQDPSLMKHFAQSRILCTICPISSKELQIVKKISELPIQTYLDAGVPFSINSDDPAYFGGYIQENYCAVQEAFGLKVTDWQRIVSDAVGLSWCADERKLELMAELEKVMKGYA